MNKKTKECFHLENDGLIENKWREIWWYGKIYVPLQRNE